jgi:S1-C subfamily serine protease
MLLTRWLAAGMGVVLRVLLVLLPAPAAGAANGIGADAAQKLYERVTPSLVAVQYTWESELGRRELAGAGVVITEDGLVMTQLSLFDMRIPDEQLKEFKLIVPDAAGGDATELDAGLLGRDERYNLVFLRPKKEQSDEAVAKTMAERKWTAIKFEEVQVRVGEPVMSVGLLPEMAAYKAYYAESAVSATLRGETPQVLVQGGGLTAVGAPVFNAEGKAIGVINMQAGQTPFLNGEPAAALNAINNPPRFYLPARDFLPALADLPQEGKPVAMPWIGIPQLTGLNKDVSEVFGLVNQPAVQVGEVIPDAPAAKAGLKQGDIVVKVNDEPLERGDEPEELPGIFRRQMSRKKVGETVKLSVLRAKGEPLQEIAITTEEMPKRPNMAKRWYAEDLGFSAREVVFTDTYTRRLKPDAKGVIVSLIRPQSAAQSAGLQMNDMITELNREPVTDVDAFRKQYEAFRKDKPKEAVVMVVLREGNTQTIRIEPPQ